MRIGRPKLDRSSENGIVLPQPGGRIKTKEEDKEQQLMSGKTKSKSKLTRISKDQIIRFHYAIASGIK